MIKPIFTEKSLSLAKQGKYSFWVDKGMPKAALKSRIANLFDVHVVGVKTILAPGETKKNARGIKIMTKAAKKAVVTLKEGEKIDLFEEAKK